MQELINYAYLAADPAKRHHAMGDYEKLKKYGRVKLVSHEEAMRRLREVKYQLGALISKLPDNLMIAGSTALSCVLKDYEINPHDIDIYMNENDHNTVSQIDRAIRETYNTEIIVMRTQYTINWFLKSTDRRDYPIFQLVLAPVRHWSEVFASSHSDLVCVGFLTGERKFVYGKGRFDVFCETAICYSTTSFTDEEYQQRVLDAVAKYRKHGFEIHVVSTDRVIVKNQIENSPRFEVRVLFQDIEKFILTHPQVIIGKYLHNVYAGEVFKDYIEVFSIFHRCPICSTLITEKRVCNACSKTEDRQVNFVERILRNSSPNLKYLVTGGRCGLGNEIAKMLIDCGRDVTVTSRYPQLADGKKAVKLDLKDPKSVAEFEKEVGNYDILILSAAETLHYSGNNLPNNSQKGELDWTNDFHREDTGIWHKCIDELTNEEIEDPIQINVTSMTKILRSFVAHQIKHKPENQKSVIYVTSSEGVFMDKSPFHPVTNLTKSAMEQVICTLKRQADIIGMNVVMADPGWMYTKSTNGKNIGPIKLQWGAAQVLSPLASIMSGKDVKNGSLWSRKNKELSLIRDTNEFKETKFKGAGETCPSTLEDSNVMIMLKPCAHKLGLQGWFQIKQTNPYNTKCPTCRSLVRDTQIMSLVIHENNEQRIKVEEKESKPDPRRALMSKVEEKEGERNIEEEKSEDHENGVQKNLKDQANHEQKEKPFETQREKDYWKLEEKIENPNPNNAWGEGVKIVKKTSNKKK